MVSQGKRFDMARDSSVQLVNTSVEQGNAQLATGVPPAVENLAGHEQLLQAPGGSPYTLVVLPAAGRLWVAQVCLDMQSNAAQTEDAYARIYTSAGGTLAIAQCATASAGGADSANPALSFPGKALTQGMTIFLDVNNGVPITNVVIRASGLVEVSIP